MGSAISALIHFGIILLIVSPFGVMANIIEIEQGAGGPGPAGGGGGGNRGTGRMRAEALKFVRVAPPMPAPPKPEVKLPPPVIPEVTPPTPQPLQELVKAPEQPVTMPVGTGGGSGTDQTSGSGPGSGGGVGSGIGTGRGSSVGPGTGGGNQSNHAPTAVEMYLPPMPVPQSVRGTTVIAEFDVDETGRVLSTSFTETKDRGYNKKLADLLKQYRFKPGTRPDGTPIRMKAQISIQL